MDDPIGNALTAVERLVWTFPGRTPDLRVGPVHLHFGSNRGVFLSGASDWTLDVVPTHSGDESWLGPFQSDHDGGVWTIRDAFDEVPFAGFRGALLESWTTLRNEMEEQVGVVMNFDRGTISIPVHGGEVTV